MKTAICKIIPLVFTALFVVTPLAAQGPAIHLLLGQSQTFDGVDDSINLGTTYNGVLSDSYSLIIDFTASSDQPSETAFILDNDTLGVAYTESIERLEVWVLTGIGLVYTSATVSVDAPHRITALVVEDDFGVSLELLLNGDLVSAETSENNTLQPPIGDLSIGALNTGENPFLGSVGPVVLVNLSFGTSGSTSPVKPGEIDLTQTGVSRYAEDSGEHGAGIPRR